MTAPKYCEGCGGKLVLVNKYDRHTGEPTPTGDLRCSGCHIYYLPPKYEYLIGTGSVAGS